MNTSNPIDRAIGIFDSGVGGLTVLRAIRQQLPGENLVYLGDTARLPYGTKSPVSVQRYALKAAEHLLAHDLKLLVVACNTASAVALDNLRSAFDPLPVVGVVQPGAQAAVTARPGGHHLVLATEATVRLGAYAAAIQALDASARVDELACELLVALAEEGWTAGAVARGIVQKYLDPVFESAAGAPINSLILGCTHFPLLAETVRAVVGDDMSITDSAGTTARVVTAELEERCVKREETDNVTLRLLATDGARRFARVGGLFLGERLTPADVELVDL